MHGIHGCMKYVKRICVVLLLCNCVCVCVGWYHQTETNTKHHLTHETMRELVAVGWSSGSMAHQQHFWVPCVRLTEWTASRLVASWRMLIWVGGRDPPKHTKTIQNPMDPSVIQSGCSMVGSKYCEFLWSIQSISLRASSYRKNIFKSQNDFEQAQKLSEEMGSNLPSSRVTLWKVPTESAVKQPMACQF